MKSYTKASLQFGSSANVGENQRNNQTQNSQCKSSAVGVSLISRKPLPELKGNVNNYSRTPLEERKRRRTLFDEATDNQVINNSTILLLVCS